MRMMMCWIISEYFPVPELSGDAVVYSAVVSCTPERLLVWHIGLQPTHYTNTHGSTLSQIMAQSWAASWWGSAGALLGLVYSLFRERNQGDICFINITLKYLIVLITRVYIVYGWLNNYSSPRPLSDLVQLVFFWSCSGRPKISGQI